MADLIVVEANVALGTTAGSKTTPTQAGVTIARGEVYYEDAVDSNKAKLAQADDSAGKYAKGVAITGASADGYFDGVTEGPYNPGVAVTKGVMYYVSGSAGSAGGIAPYADLTAGDEIVEFGRASSTSEIIVKINATGITL